MTSPDRTEQQSQLAADASAEETHASGTPQVRVRCRDCVHFAPDPPATLLPVSARASRERNWHTARTRAACSCHTFTTTRSARAP